MALTKDIEYTYKRFAIYIDQLQKIMAEHGVQGSAWRNYPKFAKLLATNEDVRKKIADLLKVATALDGGKTTFTTIGLIIALSIGGVGVAAMGGAFGVPAAIIAFLGTLCGGLIGNELDGTGITSGIMTKIGIEPASVGSWHSIHLGLGNSSTVDNSEGTGQLKLAETTPDLMDPSGELKDTLRRIEAEIARANEAQSRSEMISSRIETCLANMKVTQEETESNARSRVIDLNGLAHSIIGVQERHSRDHDDLTHKIQELLATTAQVESSVNASRMRSVSLQEQVNQLHSRLSDIQAEASEGLSSLKLNVNRAWLVSGALTVFLVCAIILDVLILRRT